MGKILAVTHLTLDGVMQSPARADEDPGRVFAWEAGRCPTATRSWPARSLRG